jgi:hypothetical protein
MLPRCREPQTLNLLDCYVFQKTVQYVPKDRCVYKSMKICIQRRNVTLQKKYIYSNLGLRKNLKSCKTLQVGISLFSA